jgi:hypothetical protein
MLEVATPNRRRGLVAFVAGATASSEPSFRFGVKWSCFEWFLGG